MDFDSKRRLLELDNIRLRRVLTDDERREYSALVIQWNNRHHAKKP